MEAGVGGSQNDNATVYSGKITTSSHMRISGNPAVTRDFSAKRIKEQTAQGRTKVGLFMPSFRLGGAERQVFQLAKNLDRSKFEVVLIALDGTGDLEARARELDAFEVVALDGRNPLQSIFRLKRLLRRGQVRILHSFTTAPNAYSLFAKLLQRDVRLILGNRMAVSDPGYGSSSTYLKVKQRAVEWFVRSFSFVADLVVSNSQAGHEMIGARFAARGAVIPNGIDTEQFKPDPRSRKLLCEVISIDPKSNLKLVGIIANCSPYKDYPTFLKAAKLVADKRTDVHFLSIGDDRTQVANNLRTMVRDLRLTSTFHFLGARSDIERLLPGLDVLCSSSVTEGFPNAIAEAMACGVPCVVTDVGDSRKIVGDIGIVVPPQSPEALASGLVNQLDLTPVERDKLGMASRQWIVQNFGMASMTGRHEQLYQLVLSRSTHEMNWLTTSA